MQLEAHSDTVPDKRAEFLRIRNVFKLSIVICNTLILRTGKDENAQATGILNFLPIEIHIHKFRLWRICMQHCNRAVQEVM
jgi:hypothetical protein